jgi:hypothetical protein
MKGPYKRTTGLTRHLYYSKLSIKYKPFDIQRGSLALLLNFKLISRPNACLSI